MKGDGCGWIVYVLAILIGLGVIAVAPPVGIVVCVLAVMWVHKHRA